MTWVYTKVEIEEAMRGARLCSLKDCGGVPAHLTGGQEIDAECSCCTPTGDWLGDLIDIYDRLEEHGLYNLEEKRFLLVDMPRAVATGERLPRE